MSSVPGLKITVVMKDKKQSVYLAGVFQCDVFFSSSKRNIFVFRCFGALPPDQDLTPDAASLRGHGRYLLHSEKFPSLRCCLTVQSGENTRDMILEGRESFTCRDVVWSGGCELFFNAKCLVMCLFTWLVVCVSSM